MSRFIVSIKDKNTGRDVIPPYIVNSLDGLGIILSEFLRWVLLLLWIQLKKRITLSNLKLNLVKSNNIWKIVIGAVSAALGIFLMLLVYE